MSAPSSEALLRRREWQEPLKKGVEDFQLDYAIKTLKRLSNPAAIASVSPQPKSR